VKVVIQDIGTQQYLARNGNWTAAARDAEDFHSSPRAERIVQMRDARQLRVLLYYEDLDYTIAPRRGRCRLAF
jgi:hypothetical protein